MEGLKRGFLYYLLCTERHLTTSPLPGFVPTISAHLEIYSIRMIEYNNISQAISFLAMHSFIGQQGRRCMASHFALFLGLLLNRKENKTCYRPVSERD